MVMDAGLHEPCALLPGSKRDGHMPIYPQIAAAAANGFTAEELESLLFLSPDGIASAAGGVGGSYLNVAPTTVVPPARTNRASPPRDASTAPPSVAQLDDSEAFSDIVLGYMSRMLVAEDIDDRFEHYPEHLHCSLRC